MIDDDVYTPKTKIVMAAMGSLRIRRVLRILERCRRRFIVCPIGSQFFVVQQHKIPWSEASIIENFVMVPRSYVSLGSHPKIRSFQDEKCIDKRSDDDWPASAFPSNRKAAANLSVTVNEL